MRIEKRTYRDRAEYLKKAVIKRRDKLRAMALEFKGGKCEVCGYNRCGSALSFHHNDPHQKKFAVGTQGYTRSWAAIKNEIEKCRLLCMNCHMKLHHDRRLLEGLRLH